jgi:hypothetical protein
MPTKGWFWYETIGFGPFPKSTVTPETKEFPPICVVPNCPCGGSGIMPLSALVPQEHGNNKIKVSMVE